MRKILLTFMILFGLPGIALAQCNGIFPGQSVCGSLTGGPPTATPFASFTSSGTPLTTGSFTLTANATSTTVSVVSCTPMSIIFLSPSTPDAANDMATTSVVAGSGLFVVTHANNARNDRTFNYVLIGG